MKSGDTEYLEGRESILAAIQAFERRFEVILIRHDAHKQKLAALIEAAMQRGIPIRYVQRQELDALAHGASHGGVLAIVGAKPRLSAAQLIESIRSLSSPALLLLLEGVDDARNLGFILRTAEAMGVHAVLIKKHLWDFDAGEVSRPSSGAYERMKLVQIEDVEPLRQLQKEGLFLVGCLAGAKRTMYRVKLTRPTILALGGEKRGLSGAVRRICDRFITIPTIGGASSLSLSHASAILLAEAYRQRQKESLPTQQP